MIEQLENAILNLTSNISLADLKKARELLSSKYRDETRHGKAKLFMNSNLERLSYLVTRFPATYAVITDILTEVKKRIPHFDPKTLLDLGSGPGTAFFATSSIFSDLEKVTLIEQDGELIKLAESLNDAYKQNIDVQWLKNSILNFETFLPHDLTIISYALNEIDENKRDELIKKAFSATNQVLVIIEPGTKPGFEIIKHLRKELLSLGGHMIAPCPHALECPMPTNDWCHFSKRVSRSSFHRVLKEGDLNYEDEKFSYVVIAKENVFLPGARILRHPEKHSGHLTLSLCTKNEGLLKKTFSKRDKELYKQARKLDWGDTIEL